LGRIAYHSFTGRSAGVLAGGSAAAVAAHTRDTETRTWAQDHRPPSSVLRVADVLGDWEFHVPVLLAFWLASREARSDVLAGTASTLVEGYLVTKAVTMTLKSSVGRTRPDGSDSWSFPSGHASGSFTLATVICCRHGFSTGLPFVSLAAFTTAMRVAQDKHYLSDVAAGTAIGIAIGRAAAHVHGPADRKTTGFQFAPRPEYPLAFIAWW
jgi:membrane-associated phospholipid phosphatase